MADNDNDNTNLKDNTKNDVINNQEVEQQEKPQHRTREERGVIWDAMIAQDGDSVFLEEYFELVDREINLVCEEITLPRDSILFWY